MGTFIHLILSYLLVIKADLELKGIAIAGIGTNLSMLVMGVAATATVKEI
jgi:Na+-driven multidrug efflux pump